MPKKKRKKKYWLRFLIFGGITFLLILLFYNVLRDIKVVNDFYVDSLNMYAKILLWGSKLITELFGYEVTTYGKTIKIVDDFKASGIYLDRGCMGRNVLLGFTALIVAFPGKSVHKLWYIPMGIVILTLVNMLRITGLAITAFCCPQYSDINHYFVFKVAAWIIIFILWLIWFNRFSPFPKSKKQQSQKENSNL
jgi:exosortase/archaeosortase family protein